jgi:glycosyltransferase involved in cell wall biosynthesis
MDKISTVIITLNEEKKIENCLKSVVDISDEIVVVDSFSTDRTEQICLRYNVRFIQHKFEGYRDQKNYAMNQAENDYVLFLDADEVLSEELREFIKEEKRGGFVFDAYRFNRMSCIGNRFVRYGEWYPDAKIRLWNRKKGKWGGENVHESVVLKSDASLKKVRLNILHYPYSDIFEYNAQFVKFAKIWTEEKFKKAKKSNIFSAFLHSFVKFWRGYVFKLGFLDGYLGYVIAKTQAHYTFLKYAGLLDMYRQSDK